MSNIESDIVKKTEVLKKPSETRTDMLLFVVNCLSKLKQQYPELKATCRYRDISQVWFILLEPLHLHENSDCAKQLNALIRDFRSKFEGYSIAFIEEDYTGIFEESIVEEDIIIDEKGLRIPLVYLESVSALLQSVVATHVLAEQPKVEEVPQEILSPNRSSPNQL